MLRYREVKWHWDSQEKSQNLHTSYSFFNLLIYYAFIEYLLCAIEFAGPLVEYKYEQNMALASKVAQAAGWDNHVKKCLQFVHAVLS